MTNEISDRFRQGLAAFEAITEERDKALTRAEGWEKAYSQVAYENESLRTQLHALELQHNYYMRHSIELKTQLESAVAIMNDALRKAQHGASRPDGTAAARMDALAAEIARDPAPKFLTEIKDDNQADK